MADKSRGSSTAVRSKFVAEHRLVQKFTLWGIEKNKGDADTQLTSQGFQTFFPEKRIADSYFSYWDCSMGISFDDSQRTRHMMRRYHVREGKTINMP